MPKSKVRKGRRVHAKPAQKVVQSLPVWVEHHIPRETSYSRPSRKGKSKGGFGK